MEIDDITQLTDLDLLLRLSQAGDTRRMWEEIRTAGLADGEETRVQVAEYELDRELGNGVCVRDVSPLHALAASARLVDMLTGVRWVDMRNAREQGSTWQEIGDALGMTRQGAYDWYARKITKQAKYVPDLHDTDRARAALTDDREKR
ncbi:hypothetical protein [Embleya sp. NPDC059237]|uniref:hypothetical protein n=1 Tax=Embleya sp. NPDC059237 TaxID=3346784 RepID=UPI00368CF04A